MSVNDHLCHSKSCMLAIFFFILLAPSADFFKINFFFQEHYQSVKRLGSSLGPVFCWSSVCKSYQQQSCMLKATIFLLVDLQDLFFRLRVGETKKNNSENDQLTGHF